MKHTIGFEAEGYKAKIEVELREMVCDVAPHLTIDGEAVGEKYTELSICADTWRMDRGFWRDWHGGQCSDEIRRIASTMTNRGEDYISELCDIWDRWHLNGMMAGSRAQMEALKSPEFDPNAVKDRYGGGDYYASACKYLSERGLNPDPGVIIPEGTHMRAGPYSYGHAWLVEKIPAEVVARIEELCKLLTEKV